MILVIVWVHQWPQKEASAEGLILECDTLLLYVIVARLLLLLLL